MIGSRRSRPSGTPAPGPSQPPAQMGDGKRVCQRPKAELRERRWGCNQEASHQTCFLSVPLPLHPHSHTFTPAISLCPSLPFAHPLPHFRSSTHQPSSIPSLTPCSPALRALSPPCCTPPTPSRCLPRQSPRAADLVAHPLLQCLLQVLRLHRPHVNVPCQSSSL